MYGFFIHLSFSHLALSVSASSISLSIRLALSFLVPFRISLVSLLASSSFPSEVLEWLDEHRHQLSWKPIHEDETVQLPSQCSASSSSLLVELNPTTNTLNEATTSPPIWLHLIPSPTRLEEVLSPQYNQHLTNTLSIGSGDRKTSGKNDSRHRPKKIVHLHQDVWLQKTEICKCRLLAQLGCSPIPSPPTTTTTDTTTHPPRRIFARKTIAKRINATIAMDFLDQHHLWGATRAKYYYGLFWKRQCDEEDLVAVATFSARRKVQRWPDLPIARIATILCPEGQNGRRWDFQARQELPTGHPGRRFGNRRRS